MNKRWRWLVLAALFWTIPASAKGLKLLVQENLKLYQRPSLSSQVISQLNQGDQVPISARSYKGFRKVLIIYHGQRRVAYVRSRALRRSRIVERVSTRQESVLSQKSSLGIALVGSYLRQGDRSVTTSSDEIYNISVFESLDSFVSLFAQVPTGERSGLRMYLNLRKSHFIGSATLDGVAQQEDEVQLEQDFLGAGLLLQFYQARRSRLWWGLFVELSKGRSVDLTINGGTPVATRDEDLPFFLISGVSGGWNIGVSDSLFLIPEIRLGVVANTDPYILTAEAHLATAYAF